MRNILGVLLIAIFVGLSALHLYWAFGGRAGSAASVPSVAGKPLFRPSPLGTTMVAAALLVAALVTCGAIGRMGDLIPARVCQRLMLAISLIFLLRAIGDFRLVGFFKPATESAFGYRDTFLYSPLSLCIAAAAFVLSRARP